MNCQKRRTERSPTPLCLSVVGRQGGLADDGRLKTGDWMVPMGCYA
ncbi:MAG: hypothetical protein WBQ68_21225 [Terriglobales bacterium]